MSGFLTLGSLAFLRVAIVRRTGPARFAGARVGLIARRRASTRSRGRSTA